MNNRCFIKRGMSLVIDDHSALARSNDMKKIIILFLILASDVSFAGNQVGTIQKLFVSGRDYAAPTQNPTHITITGNYIAKSDCVISGYWAVNTDT